MVIICLVYKGRKGQRSFRIVAKDKRKARDTGNYIELLGNYNLKNKEIHLNKSGIEAWINKGAKASEAVLKLIRSN